MPCMDSNPRSANTIASGPIIPSEQPPGQARWRWSPGHDNKHQNPTPQTPSQHRMGWTTWWLSRGARTRSHPELGRENPQRPWYCVLRHGRVGRRQVFQPIQIPQPGANPQGKPRGKPRGQAPTATPGVRRIQPRGGAAR